MHEASLLNKILSLSPYIELLFRIFYWKTKLFKGLNKGRFKSNNITSINIENVFNVLKDFGVCKGDLLILHSSYERLASSNIPPNEMINRFLDFIGFDGTLAMNAGRSLKWSQEDGAFIYDVQKSRVWTGVLPALMIKRKDAKISKFPINSMVAIGPKAEAMMSENLAGHLPSSCGPNSSWKYCLDNGAWIVGLGIDLTHSLTMIHVAEECKNEMWPIKGWFEQIKYKIIDRDKTNFITANVRKEKWGKIHFAERTLALDLIKAGILKQKIVDGLMVEIINAKNLIDYLEKRNHNGYPYFLHNISFLKL
ncbi:MAG TPA: AAC(3) family N-acetyltransferase [Sediminibacterium sp.]|uniref:AAC(3) family N-acetyltransferase n=1 Tax=Sediminibacterium sp. TaxID=1917865 RepID=UPI0008CC4F47|nr:AAC(3) family N-acetyltransferase [Sediminibacterium sp.]OHC84528.1 MAG: hypothetical protein A2472_11230 [Sphingobacteriia bacterium RIFOXYC2_FULL_35_18]OHC89041.1 MAG: hypothetical protein A2546_09100 [Sphingobacteriia bacterium RIFOXYD2_FULL_35_12]HLD53093.1 AAC(3) family N-acetyltransferase [Sediminibacterium sp.]